MLTDDKKRRKELADFLKTRRAQRSPQDVGLPNGTRRRTPGLRREEVASLAHVGVTWYTWLEQGREIGVSEQVLDSISKVLGLEQDEKEHLFRLARKPLPTSTVPGSVVVSPTLQGVIDGLETRPAWVVDQRWNVLAWNRAAEIVFGDFGTLPEEERNFLRFLFGDDDLRQRVMNWEEFARGKLATFRSSSAKYVDEPWFTQLVEDLTEVSADFREWWGQHEVRRAPVRRAEIDHPDVGCLILESLSLRVNSDPGQRVCVYGPVAGSDTADKIHRLFGSAITK